MPSSISNSNDRLPDWNYRQLWLSVLAVFLLLIAAAEIMLRLAGYRPASFVDNDIWALRRHQLDRDTGPHQIALVGSSRIQSNLALPVIRAAFPGHDIIHLGRLDLHPGPILHDIADNTAFNGLLLLMLNPDEFLSNGSAEDLLAYYYTRFDHWGRYEKVINTAIQQQMQQNFVIAFPPCQSIMRSLKYKTFCPRGNYYQSDGELVMNISGQPTAFQTQTQTRWDNHWKNKSPAHLESRIWETEFQKLKQSIRLIQERGGRVVLLTPPTSRTRENYENRFYPRQQYLGRLAEETDVLLIHYSDLSETQTMEAFDASHLERKDAIKFTERVIVILKQNGYTPGRGRPEHPDTIAAKAPRAF